MTTLDRLAILSAYTLSNHRHHNDDTRRLENYLIRLLADDRLSTPARAEVVIALQEVGVL